MKPPVRIFTRAELLAVRDAIRPPAKAAPSSSGKAARAANTPPPRTAAWPQARTVTMTSRFDGRSQVQGDPLACNPLVDDYRQVNPTLVDRALRDGPAPTLFNSGDLPPFTASGSDPRALVRLPWELRHAAAKADQREWARLFNSYSSGSPEADFAGLDPAAADQGNAEYHGRVTAWLSGRSAPR